MGGWKNEQVACLHGGVVRSMDAGVPAVGTGVPTVSAGAPAVGAGEGWLCGVYSCGLDDIGTQGTCLSPEV